MYQEDAIKIYSYILGHNHEESRTLARRKYNYVVSCQKFGEQYNSSGAEKDKVVYQDYT